ncbi:MAG: hypothetical protein JWR30_2313, partial [Conexibacter sp.]|nr:hypothetical protein [Conexibacter sp.]
MSQVLRRRLVAAAVTAGSIALVATPAADAKISKPERAQNTAIKKASKNATSAGKSAKAAAKVAAKGVADAKAAQGGVNGIVAQVPSVLDGLTKL